MTKKLHKSAIISLLAVLLCAIVAITFCYVAPIVAKADNAEPLTSSELSLVKAGGWLGDDGVTEIELKNERFDGDEGVVTYDVEISTANQLARLAYLVNQNEKVTKDEVDYVKAYNVKIIDDIDLENKLWIPIGSMKRGVAWNGNTFRGSMVGAKGGVEGSSVAISNLNSDPFYNHVAYGSIADGVNSFYVDCGEDGKIPFEIKSDEYCYGLIATAAGIKVDGKSELRIENLNVVGVKIDLPDTTISNKAFNNDRCGALVGYVAGNLNMKNCVSGQKGDYIRNTATTGGLLGNVYGGYTNGKPSGSSGTDTGTYIRITDCKNFVDVGTVNDTYQSQKAGIVGYMYHTQTMVIDNCENYGDVYGGMIGGISSYTNTVTSIVGTVDEPFVIEESFINCKNFGDIHNIFNNGNASEPLFAAGILGRLVDWWGAKDDVLKTIYRVENCINTGKITGVGTSSVGGLLGEFRSNSEFGEFAVTDCYNYGDVEGETGKVGGVIGYYYTDVSYGRTINSTNYFPDRINNVNRNQIITITTSIVNLGKVSVTDSASELVGGAIGVRKNFSVDNSTGDVTKEGSPKWYLQNRFDGGHIVIIDTIVNAYKVSPSSAPEAIAATETATLKLSDDGKVVEGLTAIPEDYYKIQIPASVEKIDNAAFMGQAKLVEVIFAENGALTEIGDFAFAGTGISEVILPDGVTAIGQGAFGDCESLVKASIPTSVVTIGQAAFGNGNLNSVVLSNSDITCDKYAFDKDSYIIAESEAVYEGLKASDNISDDVKDLLTYVVTVEYYDFETSLTEAIGSEIKLFGKDYRIFYNEITESWTLNNNIDYVGLPSLGGNSTTWYKNEACSGGSLTVAALTEILAQDGIETIKLYTRTVGAGDEFVAREDLVYDGTEYPLGAINALLASRSKKVTNETVEITAYQKLGASAPEATVPTSFRNAGTYTVQIGTSEITITIAKAKIYLANVSTLEWRINGNITLLDRDGLIDSVVRSRGANVSMTLGLYNAANKGYSVGDNPVGATQTGAGEYTSTFTLTADDNHEFVNGTIVNAKERGLVVTLENGIVTVKKTWHIIDMDNYFVDAENNDYAIADLVYGSVSTFIAPRLVHGTANDFTLELYSKDGKIGQTFTVAELNKYLNNMIPVGEYTLRMIANWVDYEETDESGSILQLHCAAFRQDVTFNVTPATLNATQVDAINNALNGKTFKFIVGAASTSTANAAVQSAVNAALEQLRLAQPSVNVEGNVWSANTAAITVNPAAAMSNVYGGFTKPTTAGVNNYYYKISLANYNAVDSADSKLLGFTVVAYGEVEIPTITSKVFNNTQQAADIVGNGQYSVTANNGGIGAGEYDVVLTLLQPECYLWKGQTVDANTATQTLKFAITKADNDFVVALNMLGWNYETFDAAINNIRATMKYLDNGQSIHFRVVKKGETTAVAGLTDFTIDAYGKVDATVASALNALKVGKYTLYAKVNGTNNYNELERDIEFAVAKAMNTWADGEGDLVLPSWIVGKFNLEENAIVVKAAHGEAIIEIRDLEGNPYYNSTKPEENTLNDLEVGKYLLVAWVEESEDFAALAERAFTIEVLEKIGLPWWGTTLVAVGALGLAAAVLLILWKLKVFEILTDKISLAITTRATVDATIAAVRATKRAEEADAHKRKVEARERLEAAREIQRNKTPEQKAQDLHAKAEATATKAERMHERAAKMRERANKLVGNNEQPEEVVEQTDDASTEE